MKPTKNKILNVRFTFYNGLCNIIYARLLSLKILLIERGMSRCDIDLLTPKEDALEKSNIHHHST